MSFVASLLLFVGLIGFLLSGLGVVYTGLWPQEGSTLDAGAMQAALAVSTMNLFANPYNVDANATATSFTDATFTGYTAQALATVPAPVNDPVQGGVSIFIPSHLFTCTTAPGSPETIYGWYLKDTTGKIVAAGNFTTPIVISAVGDTVPLQVTLNFLGGQLSAVASVA